MARDNREVEKVLLNKFEFISATTKARDHRWLKLFLPGVPVVFTKFSHTREDIGIGLWKKIAQQLRVQSPYLNGMIDCQNSRDDYYKQLKVAAKPHGESMSSSKQEPAQRRHKSRKK